jgi:membrane-associated protease RseP (regulator of RpoE activity)
MYASLKWCCAVFCLLPWVAGAQSDKSNGLEALKQDEAKVKELTQQGDWIARVPLFTDSNDPHLAPLLNWSDGRGRDLQFADILLESGDQGSGLQLAPVDEATRVHLKLPSGRGLIATTVSPNGAAARAGICQNDILLMLGDAVLAKPEDLEKGLKAAGEKPLGLIVLHQGSRKTLQVQPRMKITFGPAIPAPPAFWIGLTVSPLDPALRSHLRIPSNEGLIVTEVIAQGPASKAGIRVNDILLTVDKKPLRDQAALIEIVQKTGEHKAEVEVLRAGSPQTISVTPERRGVNVAAGRVQFSDYFHVLHPGFVVQDPGAPVALSYGPRREALWLNYVPDQTKVQSTQRPTDPLVSRLEGMATEIKELRKAIEELRKTLRDHP